MNAKKLQRTRKAGPAKLTGDCCQSKDPGGTATIRRPPGEVTGVLVTGATGYVGSTLVPALLARNYQVHALVRPSESPTARRLAETGASLLVGDLVDGAPSLPANVQAVVHLASAMFPGSDPRVNVVASIRLFESLAQADLKLVVYVSSALVYGPNDPEVAVTEQSPCRPNTSFAKGQLEVERRLHELVEEFGLPAVILRPAMIIGGRGGAFEEIVTKLAAGKLPVLGDGSQGLFVTERDDLVQAIFRCLDRRVPPGTCLNIVTPGHEASGALFRRIAEARGGPSPLRLPAAAGLLAGFLAGLFSKILHKRPVFDLDTAKVALMRGGERDINRAREILGFSPGHRTAYEALVAHYPEARKQAETPTAALSPNQSKGEEECKA